MRRILRVFRETIIRDVLHRPTGDRLSSTPVPSAKESETSRPFPLPIPPRRVLPVAPRAAARSRGPLLCLPARFRAHRSTRVAPGCETASDLLLRAGRDTRPVVLHEEVIDVAEI